MTTNSKTQDGESRLSSVAGSGNGAEAAGALVNADTAGNSATSAQSGKTSTGRGAKYTPAQALEFMQQSILYCRQAGIDARITPLHANGVRMVAVVLENVAIDDGNLMPISAVVTP